ncbi:tetraacyldisaccharide 4'-kinase [Francisella hispaniensis]|uniref:Tetraacyldisaccharide 4'-kinase n=1 Tax=Francisella hispaniensis FSC454 TaxID=1088883 RepID=A0AAC9NPI5_9GAMM|nr:tetraacyldisaccharide 4'-kinase [Francisella hispaniensis]APD51073.1 tetraacyldisaccharide 4'-kinase [Francisella hispaniensis FSC454]KYW86762.1 tetraacyldisaccharide 4'-kinase [Francisella hispaniensis FSC454]
MLDKIWYRSKPSLLSRLLQPISLVFTKVANKRKIKQQLKQYKSKIPIIVVGNISVGGTGKTPVVRMLAQQYLAQHKKTTIISRGYGAKADNYPFEVTNSTLATQCGDEPAMLFDALQAKVPIVIAPERVEAVKYIEKNFPDTDIIISDDGLQHYKLARDKEIVVVDATRMFGNKLCLPAGPLREPIERLKKVDQIIVIGNCSGQDRELLKNYKNVTYAKIVATEFVNLLTMEKVAKTKFKNQNVIAIAGIGNPTKFFKTLEDNAINMTAKKVFKDHHKFTQSDFEDIDSTITVVMTYKDAIKCKNFAKPNWWYLDIALDIDI